MRNRNFYRRDFAQFEEHRRKNRVFFGITVAVVGLLLLLRAMDVLPYFSFEFSWPILLVVIGLMTGFKNNFRGNGWWIVSLVGIANLTPQFIIMGKPSSHFVWPALIILIGMAIALRPKRDNKCMPKANDMSTVFNNDSTLNIDVTFAGKKEIITSKDFKGGVVSVTFAGCEINLTQADFTEQMVVLDFRVSFGGVEVIVPSHWDVQNEINPSFGSVEDGRTITTATTAENRKTLILRGNCSFGSIEIKSY